MNIEKINNYIDFDGLFTAFYKEYLEAMIPHKDEEKVYQNLREFVEHKDNYWSDIEECEFNGVEIIFTYSQSNNDANESDTQGSGSYFVIVYDIGDGEFISCDYEQY